MNNKENKQALPTGAVHEMIFSMLPIGNPNEDIPTTTEHGMPPNSVPAKIKATKTKTPKKV